MPKSNDQTKNWYEKSYGLSGFGAQRRYPNEELCRFMGRNFFNIQNYARSNIRILEVGCGSGSNLWMIAKEGFEAWGQDLSENSIALCKKMLESYGVNARLDTGDMCKLDYQDDFFDAIVDVFSSNCLSERYGHIFLEEVFKKLKPGGKFFSYFPGKNSDAFKNFAPAQKIDESTLNGIARDTSPFYGNLYPFRFISTLQYDSILKEKGFRVNYLERVSRTYSHENEYFEFVVIEASKPDDAVKFPPG